MIPVYENYKGYQPPRHVHGTVVKLLSKVPQQYLSGLQSVVLTNSDAVGRGKTHRVAGRKHRVRECLGFYHPKRAHEPPWIELLVDNIIIGSWLAILPRWMLRVPVVRNMAFADTLFHEVGHHLEHTIGAPARRGEAAAEAWRKRLSRAYFRKSYWYLLPLLHIVYAIAVTQARRKPS
jgi:hypothetical protein